MQWCEVHFNVYFLVAFIFLEYPMSCVSLLLPSGCNLSNNDLFGKTPFLWTNDTNGLDFFLPTENYDKPEYFLEHGETFHLACLKVSNVNKEMLKFTCNDGKLLQVDKSETVKFEDVKCEKPVDEIAKVTKKPCTNSGGTWIEIGYNADGWHNVLSVCHNITGVMSYFSTHTIQRQLISSIKSIRLPKRPKTERSPSFKKGVEDDTLYGGESPSPYYVQKNQAKLFQELQFQNRQLFLEKGHLSPAADFPFQNWRSFTYIYVNSAPQWSSINKGAWKNLENIIRANKKSDKYKVATGTYGVYNITEGKSQNRKLFLNNSKIPVPAYFWKIVQDPVDQSCIAFVCTNDPFLSKAPAPICNDICRQTKWPEVNPNKDLKGGFIYCCNYYDLKKQIVDVPRFRCRRTLPYVQ